MKREGSLNLIEWTIQQSQDHHNAILPNESIDDLK